MTILVDFVCTRDACFNPGWGEPNEPHYVLSLGAMVEIEKDKMLDGITNDIQGILTQLTNPAKGLGGAK